MSATIIPFERRSARPIRRLLGSLQGNTDMRLVSRFSLGSAAFGFLLGTALAIGACIVAGALTALAILIWRRQSRAV